MSATKIQWATDTWNPVTGCTKISEGCRNCYAERIARRFSCEPFDEVEYHEERLNQPLHWRKPRRIFVCSVSDLFHEKVSDIELGKIFFTMALAYWHTFMVLTKRPARMYEILSKLTGEFWATFDFNYSRYGCAFLPPGDLKRAFPLRNIWLGVTAENQEMADERIPILLQTPAAVRFVSVEPMLEKVDIYKYLTELNWVICGAESGPGARPFDMDWARDLKNQCKLAYVPKFPFFLKQGRIDGQLVKMPELDGRVWAEYPE